MLKPLSTSDIILSRTSRRTYRTELLSDDLLATIQEKIDKISIGPLGTALSFSLINLQDASNEKLKLGTYGFIQGAHYFIGGQILPSETGFIDFGYALEKLILELTGMGLGTCWLGGTFDRSEFARAMGLKEGNVIPAITPVGYATSTRRLGERLIRLGAGSKKRLPPEQLFFDKEPSKPLILPAGHPWQMLLEAVRIGPSASNNQPWRIVADQNQFRFYISRKPGYQKAFKKVDIQMIDMGIAMAHFDLVAREKGIIANWDISTGAPSFTGLEYVISVLLQE